ncbi:hypothetical protein PGT21_016654 [Puccinia graminis f. sp. tritici]|uniref:Uncharacterized protein n=1 Tax=Puccinia graminis f. sp. tritici TaxID=56615 RepID=A0A5B0LZC7_PUCGR|nr:hypothetical protein PGT21_016654 [Puccinia graminis f. sp. tritici]
MQPHTYQKHAGPGTRFIPPNLSNQSHYQPHVGSLAPAGAHVPSEYLAPAAGPQFNIANPQPSPAGAPSVPVSTNGAQGAGRHPDLSTPQLSTQVEVMSGGHRTNPSPTHGQLGLIGRSETGGIGPVRTTPQTSHLNHSPYRYEARSSAGDSASSFSQRSSLSDLSNDLIRPETLTYIRENYQQLQESLDNHKEFTRIGQPLFMQERWAAAIALILHRDRVNISIPAATPGMETTQDTPNLKSLVSTNIRVILLDPKLDIYGQRVSASG